MKMILKNYLPIFAIAGVFYSNSTNAQIIVGGMGNPASNYCVNQMLGTLKTVLDASGGEQDICILPNGQRCEAWALFNGHCPVENKLKNTAPVTSEKTVNAPQKQISKPQIKKHPQ